mmetsp:Transcript_12308/g.22276  ORF Transcript_12308/g.22276 Transcript_12308/m.22276 type:complete len:81 (+) Transcript_12308:514-756(+)
MHREVMAPLEIIMNIILMMLMGGFGKLDSKNDGHKDVCDGQNEKRKSGERCSNLKVRDVLESNLHLGSVIQLRNNTITLN